VRKGLFTANPQPVRVNLGRRGQGIERRDLLRRERHIHRAEVVRALVRLARAEDYARHARLGHRPSDGDLSDARPARGRHLSIGLETGPGSAPHGRPGRERCSTRMYPASADRSAICPAPGEMSRQARTSATPASSSERILQLHGVGMVGRETHCPSDRHLSAMVPEIASNPARTCQNAASFGWRSGVVLLAFACSGKPEIRAWATTLCRRRPARRRRPKSPPPHAHPRARAAMQTRPEPPGRAARSLRPVPSGRAPRRGDPDAPSDPSPRPPARRPRPPAGVPGPRPAPADPLHAGLDAAGASRRLVPRRRSRPFRARRPQRGDPARLRLGRRGDEDRRRRGGFRLRRPRRHRQAQRRQSRPRRAERLPVFRPHPRLRHHARRARDRAAGGPARQAPRRAGG
jgi:hypothetical protein